MVVELRVVAWHCEVIRGLWVVEAGSSRASSNGLLSVTGGSGIFVFTRGIRILFKSAVMITSSSGYSAL